MLKAADEIGVIETTENDGQRIREYQMSCGFYEPVPWCACFITWLFKSFDLPVPKYPAQAKAWTKINRIYPAEVQPGDISTIYYPRLGRVGHVMLVEAIDADHVYTIEGNTRPWSDDEGDRVMRKLRPWGTIYASSNWIGDRYYLVKPGDNLYRIGLRFGISLDEIRKINKIHQDYIRVGDILIINCNDI